MTVFSRKWTTFLPAILLVLLTGCLYPNGLRQQNQVAVKESVLIVQNAIDQYRQKTGVLPLKNAPMDTPLYEKYIIDFKKLTDRKFISTVPAAAYENGGTALFVLINPEENAEVKLMDLIAHQKVSDIQNAVDSFKTANKGNIPKGEQSAPGFYRLDFTKLGKSSEQVKSFYSGQLLGLLIHESGKVVIDYAPDIARLITKNGLPPTDPKLDLRTLLVKESFYVPVRSSPYYWINEQPLISQK